MYECLKIKKLDIGSKLETCPVPRNSYFFGIGIRNSKFVYGFTLVELLVVLAIIGMLAGISIGSFYSYRQKYALDQAASGIVATLAEARSRTTASEYDSQYGVHFDVQFYTLFKGTVYSASDPTNEKHDIPGTAHISYFLFTPVGPDVIFQKISGKSSQTGTVIVSLVADPTSYKTITIYETGMAEVQ